MTTVCVICQRASHGFLRASPQGYRCFCSSQCQTLYQQLIEHGVDINPWPIEQQAIEQSLQALSRYLDQHRLRSQPLSTFSKGQMTAVMHVILSTYQQTLKTHYQQEIESCLTPSQNNT